MKKTVQITIAGTQFNLEETAYQKLAAYLESLNAYFRGESEIVEDIESRIAEKLLEKKKRLIGEEDVEEVIAEIGYASQFDDRSGEKESPSSEGTGRGKKLYRNPDNAVIAGVASGIAAFFNVDPFIFRLIFGISVLFGGTGVVIYIILWLLIPEAKSASQKLEMQGDPVTLEGISKVVKERINETKERGTLKRIASFPIELVRTLFSFMTTRLFPLLGKLVGILLFIGSFFAILGLTTALSLAIAHWDKPYLDIPLRDMISPLLLWVAIGAGYVTALIPLLLVSALGHKMVRGKNSISNSVGLSLIGVWCLAIIVTGTAVTRIVGDYFSYVSSNPEYQEVIDVIDLPQFEQMVIKNSHVVIRHGEIQKVALEGRRLDIDTTIISVTDGVLSITPKPELSSCFLCDRSLPAIIIETPDIETIEAENSSVLFDDFLAQGLEITNRHGNFRGTIAAENLLLKMDGASMRGEIHATEMTLNAVDSHLDLDGEVLRTDMTLRNSSLSGKGLSLRDAIVNAHDSFANLNISDTLDLTEDDSEILYSGTPELVQ